MLLNLLPDLTLLAAYLIIIPVHWYDILYLLEAGVIVYLLYMQVYDLFTGEPPPPPPSPPPHA